MRVFHWTKEFHVHRESSLVSVWVALPALPIHFFDKHSFLSILSPVGTPLFLYSATASSTRPSVARACVEVDLLKPVCSRVWVAVEGEGGFWQEIVIEHLPSYCSSCWRLGHSNAECNKDRLQSRPGHLLSKENGKRIGLRAVWCPDDMAEYGGAALPTEVGVAERENKGIEGLGVGVAREAEAAVAW
ncbi:uncharacterized protein [Coffea arabica]|uniref:DUF4283 domain-containing protein n=1 Tax=Coffea arabica TaxID=13443 RepID=A0ABM4VYX2_COFAR